MATSPASCADLQPVWLNEPARWRRSGTELTVTTDAATDFWRRTHYGFVRDNGHFFGARVPGDFVAEVAVQGDYRDQYDQAGLMVRMDAEHWLKCGIERVDGRLLFSTVVTHAVSDWSTVALPAPPQWLRLRLTRAGDTATVEYALDDAPWQRHRLAFLPADLPVSVGPMAASPDGGGFDVLFRDFEVTHTGSDV